MINFKKQIQTPVEIKNKIHSIEIKKQPERYNKIRYNGFIMDEHRAIWIMHYGDIPKNHLIHHKNGNPKDNRIENLQLMTFVQHMNLHKKLNTRKRRKTTNNNGNNNKR